MKRSLVVAIAIMLCAGSLSAQINQVELPSDLKVKLEQLRLTTPNPPGGGEDDPPVVTIFDINMVEIDAMTVDQLEPFTLIGYAVGNVPFFYYWLLEHDGETTVIAADTSYLIDYMLSEPGDYIIAFLVTDVNGLEGSDSVMVIVTSSDPVPVQETTWGQIKALYR
jgi:hypothetical protein